MSETAAATGRYMASPNRVVSAANGIDYAYRDLGDGTPPLVLLQHFRGNLDNWDPELIDGGHFIWEEAPAEYAAIVLDSIGGS